MVYFPVRKCYHVAKVCGLLVLVVMVLTLFEHWHGGKRSAQAVFTDPLETEYELQILQDEARIVPGLGEEGVASHLTGEEKRLGEESLKKLAINVYLSDRIAYNRTLKDHRNPACQRVLYDAELPSASVIIIFHNEPYSVVIRTLWSVINSAKRTQPWYQKANFVERHSNRKMNIGYPGQDPSSPLVYLKEIILVDDNSTLPELKGKLSHYIRTRLPRNLIKILRLPDRLGLTRARLEGARFASGDVLVFLDSHCEGMEDWLRPLLARIKQSSHAVVMPIIDVIEASDFYYSVQDPYAFQVGGFTFNGHFTWVDVPEHEKKRRGSDIAPTWSPTMAGGLFAINRAYFWEVGAYDEQMAGWGGENLEMSFRIWQCGGTLETIPCSRVGHVFRSFHPYGMPAHTDTHGINTARMADVWMDEYAELFYLHRPDLRKNPKIGDITHRKILREKLKCKSFQWYLDNIYKEKFVPVRDVFAYGRFQNPSTGQCLDSLQREGDGAALGLYQCHSTLQPTQYFALSLSQQLRDEERCAALQYNRRSMVEGEEEGRKVLMTACREKQRSQKWRYLHDEQLIQHVESKLCLQAVPESGEDVIATNCRRDVPLQRWTIDHWMDENESKQNNEVGGEEPSEQELRLRSLRGKRRKSRSLMSFPEDAPVESVESNSTRRHPLSKHNKHKSDKHKIDKNRSEKHKSGKHKSEKRKSRKHKNKKSKTAQTTKTNIKNKFILKLLRDLNNGTEEHLEVDIYCPHIRLYPNNSFVRDLVSILNDKNIKVINNGRVFEHNKVTELAKTTTLRQKEDNQKSGITDGTEGPLEYNQTKPRKKSKKIKQPKMASEPAEKMLPMTEVPHSSIIVEDFAEIKPATTSTPRKLKRGHKKRKNKKQRVPTATEVLRAETDEASVVANKHSDSVEDVPMVDSKEMPAMRTRETENARDHHMDKDNDSLPNMVSSVELVTAPTARRSPARARSTRQSHEQEQSSIEGTRSQATKDINASPVKLVVRSNFTFNLGEDFFNWRRRAGDELTGILDELAIPSNWTRLRPVNPDKMSGETSSVREDEESGSSNSSQE